MSKTERMRVAGPHPSLDERDNTVYWWLNVAAGSPGTGDKPSGPCFGLRFASPEDAQAAKMAIESAFILSYAYESGEKPRLAAEPHDWVQDGNGILCKRCGAQVMPAEKAQKLASDAHPYEGLPCNVKVRPPQVGLTHMTRER